LLGGQSLQIGCGKEVEHPQENALESAVCAPGWGRPVVRKSAASGRLSSRESRRGSDCVALNPEPKAFESADDRAFAGGVSRLRGCWTDPATCPCRRCSTVNLDSAVLSPCGRMTIYVGTERSRLARTEQARAVASPASPGAGSGQPGSSARPGDAAVRTGAAPAGAAPAER